MKNSILRGVALGILIVLPQLSVAGGPMEVESLFKLDFAGFVPPTASQAKQGAVSRKVENTTYDEVWNAVVQVSMQRQVIISASKHSGILVALQIPRGTGRLLSGFPTVVVVERLDETEVMLHCNWLPRYYTTTGSTPVEKVKLGVLSKNRLGRDFLDKVVNQAFAKKRWGYLRR